MARVRAARGADVFEILNDIRVAFARVRGAAGADRLSLLGASFSGGVCAYYAAKRSAAHLIV